VTAEWDESLTYAIRIPANDSLERDIAELLTRPVGRPSHKLVVRYTRVGFIVTNLRLSSAVLQ
jgi:hypothetical protein